MKNDYLIKKSNLQNPLTLNQISEPAETSRSYEALYVVLIVFYETDKN